MWHTNLTTKRKRFADNADFPRFLEEGKELFDTQQLAGHRWEAIFQNDNPLVLELAAGRAEYSRWLAKMFPDTNYVAIDIKGHRLRYGVRDAIEHSLQNIGFLRTIIHHLDQYFAPDEVDEIRIVHPDPRPKGRDERRRLTHGRFLEMYERILKSWWVLRLKTDDAVLFDYSVESLMASGWMVIDQTRDLYQSLLLADHHGIRTYYEELFVEQGRTIHYLIAQKH